MLGLRSTWTVCILVVLVFTLSACNDCVDCYNAFDMTPENLLQENDIVMIGKLVETDTIASLGRMAIYGKEYDEYLVQYSFLPHKVFKPDACSSTVHVWLPASIVVEDGYRSGLKWNADSLALVYGDSLRPSDLAITALAPVVYVSQEEMLEIYAGERQADPSIHDPDDIQFLRAMMALEPLDRKLQSSWGTGVVLYIPEENYHTHRSFYWGHLQYCDSAKFMAKCVTSEEYLEELRKLVE